MELEPSSTPFTPTNDPRPKLVEPPPVRLVAIADVELPAPAGREAALDAFYVGILKFEREAPATPDGQGTPEGAVPDRPGATIVYKAENARLRFAVVEAMPPREEFRFTGVEVPSLADVTERLDAAEIEYVRQRGLFVGQVTVQLSDPAGNLVELSETRRLR